MTNIVTHFPPQTYSSSFFLNVPIDDEKNNGKVKSGPGTFLDCFISTTTDKDIDNVDVWKQKRNTNSTNKKKNNYGGSTGRRHNNNAFERWRHSVGVKTSSSDNKKHRLDGTTDNGIVVVGNNDDEMSLLKFLAINALDLSAPATDILLKSRNNNWFQLSGHPDSLAPAGPGTVWKKRTNIEDSTERTVYEQLTYDQYVNDIIPKYYREVDYKGEKFIELQDLLHEFDDDPFMIDIKMGTRTFLESEVKNTTARSDLYHKMIAVDPTAPTSDEHKIRACTKLRYMQFREHQSSTCSHGFRIEAMKCRGLPPVTDLKKVRSDQEVIITLKRFLNGNDDVRRRIITRLCEMREKIECSEFFHKHEVIGSSLFIVYDNFNVGVWLIDFAKTNPVPDGMTVDHRRQWVQGNHEEGLLYGFDMLIQTLEKCVES